MAAFIKEKGWDAFRQEEVRVLQGILSGNNAQPTWSNDVDGVDPSSSSNALHALLCLQAVVSLRRLR